MSFRVYHNARLQNITNITCVATTHSQTAFEKGLGSRCFKIFTQLCIPMSNIIQVISVEKARAIIKKIRPRSQCETQKSPFFSFAKLPKMAEGFRHSESLGPRIFCPEHRDKAINVGPCGPSTSASNLSDIYQKQGALPVLMTQNPFICSEPGLMR